MAKVNKFTDKIKKIKRQSKISFPTDGGEFIEFALESRSQELIDSINAKYDAKRPNVPSKRLPAANNKFKIVENPDDKDYRRQLAEIQRENFAELALNFLAEDERPEGTLEEQLKEIRAVELAGFIPKIVQRGLEISGILDEEVEYEADLEEAKND